MKKAKKFRVWIGQVNQTFVDVTAVDADVAREKAYRKWRREDAHAQIESVKLLSPNSLFNP